MLNKNTLKNIFFNKLIIWAVMLIFSIPLYYIIFSETNADIEKRIKNEIEIVKMRNISYATKEREWLNIKLENLEAQIQKIKNDMYIYSECIKLNKIKDLPTNCRDITISLKDDLWWRINSNWVSQEYKQLIGDTPKARAEYLLDSFTHTKWTIDIWIELWYKYNIDPYLAISIAKADSSLWRSLKSKNNIGNVGNNDRWDTVLYTNKADGIEAIFRVLNNKYLSKIYTIGYLSCGGKIALWIKDCFQNGEKVYATSKENWNLNVINTMRIIYRDSSINELYNFRTNK